MVVQERPASGTESLLHRRKLNQHIGAVPLFLDHLLQTPHLALDPSEPRRDRMLGLWIDRGWVNAITGSGGTGARCDGFCSHGGLSEA
jgi:hypothetical protein